MSDKKLITEEGKQRLLQVFKETMQVNAKQLDEIRPVIRDIKATSVRREELGLEASVLEHNLIRMLEYNLLLGLISLDICAAYRSFLKGEEFYDGAFATKQLIVILNEAYKKIYNYVWPNEKGDLITTDRNKSFWKKDIGNIVVKHLPELTQDYQRLTGLLDTFQDPELRASKLTRDMFVHYDNEPSKLFDVLCALDMETTSQKIIPFLEILKEMIAFMFKLQSQYTIYLRETTKQAFAEHRQKLEGMKIDKAGNVLAIAEIEKGIANLAEMQKIYDNTIGKRDGRN